MARPFVVKEFSGLEPTIQQMTDAELDNLALEVLHKALAQPNAFRLNLQADSANYNSNYEIIRSSGTKSLTISDNRRQATAATAGFGNNDSDDDADDFDAPGSTLGTVTIDYDHLLTERHAGTSAWSAGYTDNAANLDSDNNNTHFPVYGSSLDATLDLRSMTGSGYNQTSGIDYEIITRAASIYINDTNNAPGQYQILTTNSPPAGSKAVGSAAFYNDTIADISLYTADGIPETLDQPETAMSFYLHQADDIDSSRSGGWRKLVRIKPTDDTVLEEMDSADVVKPLVNEFLSRTKELFYFTVDNVAASDTNSLPNVLSRNGLASRQIGVFTDTIRNSTGTVEQFKDTAGDGDSDDIYRSQRFPDGTAATNKTYRLYIAEYDSAGGWFGQYAGS